MNKSRSLLTLSLSVVAIAALPVAAQAATANASGTCGQFRVVHNGDKISGVSFPAGPYNMVNSGMSCSQTTTYFQQFLEAGKVSKGWQVKTLSGNRKRFTKLGTNPTVDFQATAASDPKPTPTPSGLTCAGTFRVLHNDRIGAMKLAAGAYTIKLASHDTPGLNCKVASNEFANFLDYDWAGNLPRPWKMDVSAKSFYMNTASDGFSVKRVSG
ncbi:MAG: hypothetical protein JHC46_04120 [Solirubrobacteraceae bacterium]|nr:hypothetical protein [Solirubrobacteraceae bacterium]